MKKLLAFLLPFALTVYRRVSIPSIQLGCLLISIITIFKHLIHYQKEEIRVSFGFRRR